MNITTSNQKFNAMIDAAFASIARRQDLYSTGAIPESDVSEDIYNGFAYGLEEGPGTACYVRTLVGHTFVRLGLQHRLRHLLDFYRLCQAKNGRFGTAYHVEKPQSLDEKDDDWLESETDSTGFVLWHAGEYFHFTQDMHWLQDYWPHIKAAAQCLLRLMDQQTGLCFGREEVMIREPNAEQELRGPLGYMAQINGAIRQGLAFAAMMAQAKGDDTLALQCRNTADIITQKINTLLWEPAENRYLMGIDEKGQPYRGAMYFCLAPSYYAQSWGPREHNTLACLWPHLYNRDPMIPQAYWSNDFSLSTEGKPSRHEECSGSGVYVGTYPVVIEQFMRDGNFLQADDLCRQFMALTDDHTNLPAEHLNTCCLGSGPWWSDGMKMYPDITGYIDRGNLFHLSFFLRLLCFLVGVGYRQPTGTVAVHPRLLPCLQSMTVSQAPLPGGGTVSYQARWDDKHHVIVENIHIDGDNTLVDMKGLVSL